MAFPTTGVLDAFNRANEGPPPSANWTSAWENNQFSVVGNQCEHTGALNDYSTAHWNVSTFGPDSECYVTVVAKPTNNDDELGVGCRMANIGAGTTDGYMMTPRVKSAATDEFRLFRFDNGVSTQLGAAVTQEIATGDAIGIEAIGSTIKAFYKASGGSWTEVMSRTDATYTAAGSILLLAEKGPSDVQFDDFGGGTVIAAAAFKPKAISY